MSKPFLLFRAPVESISGYGSHSRDLLESLYLMDLFEIKIDSSPWGVTPMNALKNDNSFHIWIKSNIIKKLLVKPDVYIQVTVPNEFIPVGDFNIGITAGIETTKAPREWIDGCNKMDLILVSSNFSKDVLSNTLYHEIDKLTNNIIRTYRITKPIEVLFEGVKTSVYNKTNNINGEISNQLNSIPSDFCFLFVGNWLKGVLGEDRKNVGMLIKSFVYAFKDSPVKPGLILKTSIATFSIKSREIIKNKIKEITKGIENPPPIYLLYGELSDEEMNQLYNHPKIKSMVTLTKGEGFGRPLLEFTMTGKPVISPNWSGQKDFLSFDNSVLIGGSLTDVHDSVIDNFIVKNSQWFTPNYDEVLKVFNIVKKNYDSFLEKSEKLRIDNCENFSFDKMKEIFELILRRYTIKPEEHKLILPELIKID
jgi:hypothetical protein